MTNKEILTAVLIEWAKPTIPVLVGNRLNGIPALNMFENWIKSKGIAPANWTILQDISPLLQGAAYNILAPIINSKMKNVPDEYIPQMAHGIVDAAIQNGKFEFLGGYISFDKSDLQELKNYLVYNLPYIPAEVYHVKTKPDAAGDDNTPHETNKNQ
jgi:hypothetical protein